jgi:hypothetical protein
VTYKIPTLKTTNIPTFCCCGRCNVASAGIGRTRIITSVRIPLGRQCFVNSGPGCQKSEIGMQKTKPLITIQRPAMMRNAIVMYVARRKDRVRKMRTKRNKAESLERIRERL